MAIEYWDNEQVKYVPAQREYETYDVMAAKTTDDYYNDRSAVTLTMYVDIETGIMVKDVGEFERWMKKVITRDS